MLGVARRDATGRLILADGRELPELALSRDVLELGNSSRGLSWTARSCRLRDRDDLGPFRLAFLEAAVRLADWKASASYEEAS